VKVNVKFPESITYQGNTQWYVSAHDGWTVQQRRDRAGEGVNGAQVTIVFEAFCGCMFEVSV